MSIYLSGIGVSKGIAIGKAYVHLRQQNTATKINISKAEIKAEIKRFKTAIKQAKKQLQQIKKKVTKGNSDDILVFIDTHLLMIEDSSFIEAVINNIKQKSCNAEWALQLQGEHLMRVFEEMDDAYLRARKDDIKHVVNHVHASLVGEQTLKQDTHVYKGKIIIADDLTPADTLVMQHQKVAGFITEHGGPLSHTAILARSLAIPAIVGVRHARSLIAQGEALVLDGLSGVAICKPDRSSLKYYRAIKREEIYRVTKLHRLSGKPAVTQDKKQITLHANIDRPRDIRQVKKYDDTGIGLYRTEMLFIERNEYPVELIHYKTYKRAVFSLNGKPLTIRTVDLGADKEIDTSIENRHSLYNPALGLRAVRRSLKYPQDYMPQLQGILRASAYGTVRILIPMLTNIDELDQVLNLITQAKQNLKARRIKYDENIAIGAMIEVPAAALAVEAFAKKLDFLSIGTNDLIQYTLALDRVDDEVNYLYNPLHPAVLKLIKLIIIAGKKHNIAVSLCGEMASDTKYTRLLLGMGLEYFSVQANALLEIKQIIIASSVEQLTQKVKRILRQYDSDKIEKAVQALAQTK